MPDDRKSQAAGEREETEERDEIAEKFARLRRQLNKPKESTENG
jgi:hypothetical protein